MAVGSCIRVSEPADVEPLHLPGSWCGVLLPNSHSTIRQISLFHRQRATQFFPHPFWYRGVIHMFSLETSPRTPHSYAHKHTHTHTQAHINTLAGPIWHRRYIRKPLASKSIETPGRTNTHSVNAVSYHTRTRRIFFEPAFISLPLSFTGSGGGVPEISLRKHTYTRAAPDMAGSVVILVQAPATTSTQQTHHALRTKH